MGSTPPRPRIEVREASTPEEQTEAGRVTQEAYQEFAGFFEPGEWDDYAATLPEVQTRIDQGILLIATDEQGSIVGTVTFYPEPAPTSTHWRPDDATLRFLAVRPSHRRAGVGRALIEHSAEWARRLGKNRLAFQTTPHMTAAIDLYRKMGFLRDVYGDQTWGSFSLLGYALVIDNRTVPPAPPEET